MILEARQDNGWRCSFAVRWVKFDCFSRLASFSCLPVLALSLCWPCKKLVANPSVGFFDFFAKENIPGNNWGEIEEN